MKSHSFAKILPCFDIYLESLDEFWDDKLQNIYTMMIHKVKGINPIGLVAILANSLN